MVSLTTRVDKSGFWYLVEVGDNSDYTGSYVVIGTGGRQGSGEFRGSSSNSAEWRYVDIGFPVLHVGITDLQITERDASPAAASQPMMVESLSRRKAVRALATTLLAGGALLMFPPGTSQGQTLTRKAQSDGPLSGGDAERGTYNPYGAEREDFYRPY